MQRRCAGAVRRGGAQGRAHREPHVANVEGVESISVLFDGDSLKHLVRVDALGQRKLDEDAVDLTAVKVREY